MIVRKSGEGVQIWSRYGRSRRSDFPAIRAALATVEVDELLIDSEAVCFDADGLPDFNRLLTSQGQQEACLVAFDLLAINARIFGRCLSWPAGCVCKPSWTKDRSTCASRSIWKGRPARRCSVMPAR